MTDWQSRWKPAVDDRAQSNRTGYSGTIIEIDGERSKLKYDPIVQTPPASVLADEEPGWHDRSDLVPIDMTKNRVLRELAERERPTR